MRRFYRIQPVQVHHPHLRRPMSSRQSAYHHPLMHDAHHNRRIPNTKRGERWSTPLLGASSISIKHYTSTSVPLLRVGYCLFCAHMSMLLDAVIQHGIDDASRQRCTLPYTMGDYHQVLSRLAQWQWNVIMFPLSPVVCTVVDDDRLPICLAMWQWKICFSSANQTAIIEKGWGHAANWTNKKWCEISCKLVLPSHKISIYEYVLIPHFQRLPHTSYGKTLFFRYWRNLLQQQGMVAVQSYAHYNTTQKRCEKMRSSLKCVVQVQHELTVI